MRPADLEEFVGQKHLIGDDMLLGRMIRSGVIGSVIFYGPPSSGKTTLAYVISQEVKAEFLSLNAVLDGVKDLKVVVSKATEFEKMDGRKTILFVDEIHRWNKAQQDALLPHLESGLLTLIGATTENPFYSLVGPLLSRCQLFELYPLTRPDLETMLSRSLADEERGLGSFNADLDDEAREFLADISGGDVRNALNALEIAVKTAKSDEEGRRRVTLELASQCVQKRVFKYDKTGDEHYHYASAFIKSMRGSDADAALYWMTAMIEGGDDPNFIFRRLQIFASEDIGLADPTAAMLVNNLHEAFKKSGMPEGWYFLSHACLYCSLAPKSNSTKAVFGVISEIKKNGVGQVPQYLKDKTANKLDAQYTGRENPSKDYKYPHNFPRNWVDQTYLPENMRDRAWFEPGDEAYEKRLVNRLREIRGR